MMRIAPLVTFIFTSSLLSCTAAAASILCTWTKVSPKGEIHYSFLRSDSRQTPSPLRLYHTAWTEKRALLGCTWSDDTAVIHNYLSLCRERAQDFSDHPNENVDLDSVFGTQGQCVSLASLRERTEKRSVRSAGGQCQDERSEVSIHQRVKRFIVPGTLWCGSGNKAPSYSDLGVFSDTDHCCREHDQCQHTILSFHSEFGIFNSNIFTMSHCDCDNKFRSCLEEANDSISDVVGYTFFNLLKMHCFTFSHRLQCTQRNWFGMCKETKMALYAEVHSPILYKSTSPTDDSMNSSVINSTTSAELLESSTSNLQIHSITTAASTLPTPFASMTPLTNTTTSTGSNTTERPAGSVPDRRDNLENILPTKNPTVAGAGPEITETQMSCGIYKDIDTCRDKILPQHEKYGIHNLEPKTLYHCNCTIRLFQTLSKQRQLTKVQALLVENVSHSCFLLQDCMADSNCTAVVVKVELPLRDPRTSAAMEEQPHLQAVNLKIRQPNQRRAKRKDREVRLHKLCLRLSRRRQMKKNRKNV
ncbi:group 3 secretory phospholipase A2 [Archocentrus centrarchus]|uniref:group 3 secretory phospholipase A2 n=1 Tax=Archocentrus centrarchus TaxID=63155 RepID=UPI0011E9B51F|nr:group 3 secretory phospholipase A2-like [Archocentrus centrarchus]